MRRCGAESCRTRGQATVEFALIIPLVLVATLAVVQVTAVAYAQLTVTHAAREAVRTLAVDPGADLTSLTDSTQVEFIVTLVPGPPGVGRGVVRVTATQQVEPVSPLFGGLIEGLTVRSEAQMLAE